jgi:hypothetical protein
MQTVEPWPTCGVCNPPVMTIAPGCSTSLGWAWDGTQCIEHVGCSCSGQCDRFEPTQIACEQHYRAVCQSYFACGASSCARNAQYCFESVMGAQCMPVPCSPPTCACVLAAQPLATGCMDDGAGGLTAAP